MVLWGTHGYFVAMISAIGDPWVLPVGAMGHPWVLIAVVGIIRDP